MRQIALALALFALSCAWAADGNGLLWRVSGQGLESPSYIFGSYHLAPAEFVDSVAGLREAIAEVQAVYGEVEKDALTSAASQQAILARAMAPADSTLSILLSPGDLAQLDSLLAVYTGFPGMARMMDGFKPAIVSTNLATLQISSAFPEFNPAAPFDAAVMAIGEESGKEIGGLETLDDQLELLFGAPLTQQAQELMEAVRDNDTLIEQAKLLTEAYFAQDLDALTDITVEAQLDNDPQSLDRLIYGRNRSWAEALDKLMPTKPILAVVGAAHLGGEQGLLNLLIQKGYNVEPVY